MKRYMTPRAGDLSEAPEGRYVLHSDHEAALAAAVAKEREEIASEMDCACDCRGDVLESMRIHGRRLAKHRCRFSPDCCAIQAAEIRARSKP